MNRDDITLPRATVEQALEALEWHLARGAYGADIEGVTGNLRAALAHQAETAQPKGWRAVAAATHGIKEAK